MGAVVAASIAAGFSFVAVLLGLRNTNRDLIEQLSFEGKRDKRGIYAAALAALKKFEIERTADTETTARIAVAAVELVAPYHVWYAAHVLLTQVCHAVSMPTDSAWGDMVRAMREDLGVKEPWKLPQESR
jgi:hypothetical protein